MQSTDLMEQCTNQFSQVQHKISCDISAILRSLFQAGKSLKKALI